MPKHAYLIIVHNEFEVLRKLLKTLDDVRNDIYIHFDKKVTVLPKLACRQAILTLLPDEKRVDVRWGTVSQIKTEMALFEAAHNKGGYQYYHLISGTHLPLKSQDEIHALFDRCYPEEVMSLCEQREEEADFKLRHYHFLIRWFKHKNIFIQRCSQTFWRGLLFLQKKGGVRCNRDQSYLKSANWISITDKAVTHLLQNQARLLRQYRYSFCGDEYFVASELQAHPSEFHIHDMPHLLAVRFYRANATNYTSADFEWLMSSECLFARKFTARHMDVVNKIVRHVLECR